MKPLYSQALLQDCREKEIVCSREKIRMELSAWCKGKETNGFVYSSSMKISLIILDCAKCRFNRTRSSNQNDWFVVALFPGSPCPQTKNVYCKQPKAGNEAKFVLHMLQTSSQHYLLHVQRVGIKYSSTLQAKFLFYCTEPDESQVWAHFTRCTAAVQYNYWVKTRKNRQYLTYAGRINSLMVMVAYPANFSPD